MMNKISNEKALSHIDNLMNKVTMSKEAAELGKAVILGDAAGTETGSVTKKANGLECSEKAPVEGEHAKRNKAAVIAATPGASVETMSYLSNSDAVSEINDFNAGHISETANNVNKTAGEINMYERDRVNKLGAAINSRFVETTNDTMSKLSAEDQEAVSMFKTAADAHYVDYVDSFALGMQKKASDVADVMEAKGVSEEEAAALLEDIAAEDPSLVIPEDEGMEGMEGMEGISGEDAAILEELVQELEEAGVTPEELAALAEEVDQEDAIEKTSSERADAIKSRIRFINSKVK